jgi:SAM-dependent methyltransferase
VLLAPRFGSALPFCLRSDAPSKMIRAVPMSSTTETTMEFKQPSQCPICQTGVDFIDKRVGIVNGKIFKCKKCKGYFLYPKYEIEYNDSGWSKDREVNWDRLVARANRYAPLILNKMQPLLGRPIKSVLEIGCGSAYMGKGFESVNCCYTGIDADATSIEYARRQGVNAFHVLAEDIMESPLAGNTYDLVITSNVFEHLNNPMKALANIRQLCKGIIVIIVPNANGLFQVIKANSLCRGLVNTVLRSKRRIAYSIDGYWHNISYGKKTLQYLCDAVGLKPMLLSQKSINDPVFGFVQENKSRLYRLASGFSHLLGMDSEIILICKAD